ncbi:polysaccharide deacetylase family protein [Corticibacterium sp. UT-5YL-CI-8]|nr:polysaccharide deacetylase family protein [Tianweitania sp. UT-5YL-CI-8]
MPIGTFTLAGEKAPSLSTRTAVQYGFQIGLPRLRDIVENAGIKITLGTTGNAAERHAPLIKDFFDRGHEIAAHGYNEGVPPVFLNREEQGRDIDMTLDAITKATGKRPLGWWSPGALCNGDTIELLADRGLLYHGDLQDDEIPYFIDVNGKTLVEIPYNMVRSVNDYASFTGQRRSTDEHLAYFRSTFDAYYEQAATTQLILIWGTHPFVSGRPETAYVFAKFLDYMRQRDDVWFATYSEVAEWWSKRFGPAVAS